MLASSRRSIQAIKLTRTTAGDSPCTADVHEIYGPICAVQRKKLNTQGRSLCRDHHNTHRYACINTETGVDVLCQCKLNPYRVLSRCALFPVSPSMSRFLSHTLYKPGISSPPCLKILCLSVLDL